VKLLKLVLSLGLIVVVNLIGWVFSKPGVDSWYHSLNKPSFTPPSYVFSIVWPILYILIGLCLFAMLIRSKPNRLKFYSYLIYAIQLFLNVIWSYLFFTIHNLNLALIDIYLLLLSILVYMLLVVRWCRPAFYLFIPYAIWVLFACVLYTRLWVLN
jgi:translocator protein